MTTIRNIPTMTIHAIRGVRILLDTRRRTSFANTIMRFGVAYAIAVALTVWTIRIAPIVAVAFSLTNTIGIAAAMETMTKTKFGVDGGATGDARD